MGVDVDRVFDGFTGPFEKVPDLARVPAGAMVAEPLPAGYSFSPRANDSFTVVNRLLKAGESVSSLGAGPFGPGTFYVSAKTSTVAVLRAATNLGVSFQPVAAPPRVPMSSLAAPRIGLFDTYGGSMPSGWTRLILEAFEFSYQLVFPPDLDAGTLRDRFDVLVFNGSGHAGAGSWRRCGGAPAAGPGVRGQGAGRAGFTPQPVPPQYARRQGQVSAATMEKIKAVRARWRDGHLHRWRDARGCRSSLVCR